MNEAAKLVEVEKKPINILPSQLTNRETVQQQFVLTAKPEQAPEDFEDPRAYSTIAEKIRPTDEITVIHEGGDWMMKLYVIATSRQWVRVHRYHFSDLKQAMEGVSAPDEGVYDEYDVKWRGPHGKFAVVRKEDNSVISSGHEDREAAEKAKNEYIRALGR